MSITIQLLSKQHREVLAFLEGVESRLNEEASQKPLLDFLRSEVLKHFSLEEEALFPALEKHPHLQQGPLRVMNHEHRVFRDLLEGLEEAVDSANRDRQKSLAIDLINLLRSHIAKEDRVLFPMAEQTLNEAELTAVDEQATRLGVLAGVVSAA